MRTVSEPLHVDISVMVEDDDPVDDLLSLEQISDIEGLIKKYLMNISPGREINVEISHYKD